MLALVEMAKNENIVKMLKNIHFFIRHGCTRGFHVPISPQSLVPGPMNGMRSAAIHAKTGCIKDPRILRQTFKAENMFGALQHA